jgi:hypothetical protein
MHVSHLLTRTASALGAYMTVARVVLLDSSNVNVYLCVVSAFNVAMNSNCIHICCRKFGTQLSVTDLHRRITHTPIVYV